MFKISVLYEKLQITDHALQRTGERIGECFWKEEKIKEATTTTKKQFIVDSLKEKRENIKTSDSNTIKICTMYFTAIACESGDRLVIVTIINSGDLTYRIEEVLKPQQKLKLDYLKKKKAIGSRKEPTAS